MANPNKYNIHKYLFLAAGMVLLLSASAWPLRQNTQVRIIAQWGLLPSALLMFLLGLLTWRTRFRHPKEAKKLAHDKANELLEKLAQSPVGSQLTDASRKVVRIANLIDNHSYPELHVHERQLDELYGLVPACLLPGYYREISAPLLDWHKYDLCIIAADEDVEAAKKIKTALERQNPNWRIYIESLERDEIGEEQESFIKRVFYGGSLKCLVLLSFHMINHARSKQALQFAMQRGQTDDDVCRNYLIPVAMDKFGLNFMKNDDYLRPYSEHLEIIQDRAHRFEAIVRKLSKLLTQSIFYIPPTVHEEEKQPPKKRFAVALSYPGEHRPFVETVAEDLTHRLHDELIFYDRYYIPELARIDLDIYLQNIYLEESELVAVFLCAEYEEKSWCGLEWRAIRELIMSKPPDAVMLIRFDQTNIPGLLNIHGYVDAQHLEPEDVAALIVRRLAHNRESSADSSQ